MKTLTDYLTSDGKYFDRAVFASDRIRLNGQILIDLVYLLLNDIGIEKFEISSGYRTAEANRLSKGSLNSAHITGQAVDIKDVGNKIYERIVDMRQLLEHYDLYMEHRSATPGWLHLSTRAPKSGNRIFHP